MTASPMFAEVGTPVLYILMRSDLDSLNPGKAMAQAAHAANFAVSRVSKSEASEGWLDLWKAESTEEQDFGTTIVLDGGSIQNIKDILDQIENLKYKDINVHPVYTQADMVLDPTYPVRDGKVTHLIPVETCAWVFVPAGSPVQKLLMSLELHP